MTMVICKNKSCQKIIDQREIEVHIRIFHPHFMSLIRTTSNYPEISRLLTPKQLVQKLFEAI